MYTPRAFAEHDLSQLDLLFAHDPFVSLITVDAAGLPMASHLPVLYRRDGEQILIEGHWARPNPQAHSPATGLMIVHGPHSYVSASWYPDKEQAARVPTWNYAVAHLQGELQASTETAFLADIVSRLSDMHEASVGQQWRFEPDRADHARQLRGIIGFRFRPTKVELKFKLSQNHPPANRHAVISALREQPSDNARTIADWMQARED